MNGLDIEERTPDRWQWAPLWIAAGLLLLAVAIGPSVVRYELDLVAPAVFVVPDEMSLAAAIGKGTPDTGDVAPPPSQPLVQESLPADATPPAATVPPSIAVALPVTPATPVVDGAAPAPATPDTTPAPGSGVTGAAEGPVIPASRWARAAITAEPTPVEQPELVAPPAPAQPADECDSRTPRWPTSATPDSCDTSDSEMTESTVSRSAMQLDEDPAISGLPRTPRADTSPSRFTGR